MASDNDEVMAQLNASVRNKLQSAVQGGYFLATSMSRHLNSAAHMAKKQQKLLKAQMDASHKIARQVYKKLLDDRFYIEATSDDIARAYQTAHAYAQHYPDAAKAIEYADEELRELYDFDGEQARDQVRGEYEQAMPQNTAELVATSELDNDNQEVSYAAAKSTDAVTVDVKENTEASNLVENSDDLQMDPTGDRVFGAAADGEVEDAQQAREMRMHYKDMENAMRAKYGPETGTAVTVGKAGTPNTLAQLLRKPSSSKLPSNTFNPSAKRGFTR